MNQVKCWKISGSKRDYWAIISFGLLCILAILKKETLFLSPIPILLIVVIFVLRTRFFIKTSENGIEAFINFKYKKAKLTEIVGYYQTDSVIILNISSGKSVIIEKALLKESNDFIANLDEKLKQFLCTECLKCGSLTDSKERKCPNCGWSWENESKGISL